MKTILTIDIGGTSIKSALHDEKGQLLVAFDEQKTALTTDDNAIEDQIVAMCRTVISQRAIDGIAIATAGVVNPHTGEIVLAGPSIPNYMGVNLKQTLEALFQLPCVIENDVNAFALGEHWLGAAKDFQSALCLTIGTGLGGAILLDGKLWRGHHYSAGEVGYIPLATGQRLEEVASTSAMLNNYQNETSECIDGKEFFRRLNSGDEHSKTCLNLMIDTLSAGILPAIYLFSPEVIVVGGGVAEQRNTIEPMLRKAVSDKVASPRFMPHIYCADLGNRANMIGALQHWLMFYCDKY